MQFLRCCALLRSFAPFCILLRSCAQFCGLTFALFCGLASALFWALLRTFACFCVRPPLERPHWELQIGVLTVASLFCSSQRSGGASGRNCLKTVEKCNIPLPGSTPSDNAKSPPKMFFLFFVFKAEASFLPTLLAFETQKQHI